MNVFRLSRTFRYSLIFGVTASIFTLMCYLLYLGVSELTSPVSQDYEQYFEDVQLREDVLSFPPNDPGWKHFTGQCCAGDSKSGVQKMGISSKDIPMYVVEEHHEVIPYWFGAGDTGILPARTGNTLIHIDAHSDMGFPLAFPDTPFFRWPQFVELATLMTENDRFIVGAALTGVFSHVVWVWPNWDTASNLRQMFSGHMMGEVTFGTWFRTDPRTNQQVREICSCYVTLNPPAHWDADKREEKCFRFNSSNPFEIPGDEMPKNECPEKVKVKVDVISEDDMLNQTLPGGSLGHVASTGGYILDIDEDYFGCEASVLPLYGVGLKEKFLQRLSSTVYEIFCGATGKTEFAADRVFQKIVQFVGQNKKLCKMLKTERSPEDHSVRACMQQLYDELWSLNLSDFVHGITFNVNDVFCEKGKPKDQDKHLIPLLRLLLLMNSSQLNAVAEIGICVAISPNTHDNEDVGHFKLCDGKNRPGHTAVTFYTPDQHDVRTRAERMEKILRQVKATPDLVTLCRSMRDGYTPRSRFHQIETTVISILKDVYGESNNVTLTYDKDLMGGAPGWPGRWHM